MRCLKCKSQMMDNDKMFRKLTDAELERVRRAPKTGWRKSKWPLKDMAVGDEVIIRKGEYGKSNPQVYAHTYGRAHGKKFFTETIDLDVYRIVRTF